MTLIVTPMGSISQHNVCLVWAGPMVVASTTVRWLAERAAELLDDFGISDHTFADIDITHARFTVHSDVWLIWIDGRPRITCRNWSIAHRLADLLDRYGMADIPNDLSEVA